MDILLYLFAQTNRVRQNVCLQGRNQKENRMYLIAKLIYHRGRLGHTEHLRSCYREQPWHERPQRGFASAVRLI